LLPLSQLSLSLKLREEEIICRWPLQGNPSLSFSDWIRVSPTSPTCEWYVELSGTVIERKRVQDKMAKILGKLREVEKGCEWNERVGQSKHHCEVQKDVGVECEWGEGSKDSQERDIEDLLRINRSLNSLTSYLFPVDPSVVGFAQRFCSITRD